MRFALGVAALLLPVALAGCGPGGPNKSDTGLVVGAAAGGLLGNTIGGGKGRIATTAIGAVIGGIVGSEIGRSMDQQDRILAQQAELAALERGESDRPHRWRNPDNGRYGEVVPGRPFRRGPDDCREYTHRIYIDGRPQAMRGVACRNPDGTWRNVG
jgi:surface antigen